MSHTLTVRNARENMPVVVMDLTRQDEAIQRDLRARYPRVIDLWWELEDDEQSGCVYSHSRVLARLQHGGDSEEHESLPLR